jgi:hypothetical protein
MLGGIGLLPALGMVGAAGLAAGNRHDGTLRAAAAARGSRAAGVVASDAAAEPDRRRDRVDNAAFGQAIAVRLLGAGYAQLARQNGVACHRSPLGLRHRCGPAEKRGPGLAQEPKGYVTGGGADPARPGAGCTHAGDMRRTARRTPPLRQKPVRNLASVSVHPCAPPGSSRIVAS